VRNPFAPKAHNLRERFLSARRLVHRVAACWTWPTARQGPALRARPDPRATTDARHPICIGRSSAQTGGIKSPSSGKNPNPRRTLLPDPFSLCPPAAARRLFLPCVWPDGSPVTACPPLSFSLGGSRSLAHAQQVAGDEPLPFFLCFVLWWRCSLAAAPCSSPASVAHMAARNPSVPISFPPLPFVSTTQTRRRAIEKRYGGAPLASCRRARAPNGERVAVKRLRRRCPLIRLRTAAAATRWGGAALLCRRPQACPVKLSLLSLGRIRVPSSFYIPEN
jgi:hypothetical protein